MVLHFERETQIKTLQEKFSEYYAFLQLHFIRSVASDGRKPSKLIKADPEEKLNAITTTLKAGTVSVVEKRTVAEVLHDFSAHGVIVQVYRKFGKLWVETSLTGDWTLERQNRGAVMISISDDLIQNKARKVF